MTGNSDCDSDGWMGDSDFGSGGPGRSPVDRAARPQAPAPAAGPADPARVPWLRWPVPCGPRQRCAAVPPTARAVRVGTWTRTPSLQSESPIRVANPSRQSESPMIGRERRAARRGAGGRRRRRIEHGADERRGGRRTAAGRRLVCAAGNPGGPAPATSGGWVARCGAGHATAGCGSGDSAMATRQWRTGEWGRPRRMRNRKRI